MRGFYFVFFSSVFEDSIKCVFAADRLVGHLRLSRDDNTIKVTALGDFDGYAFVSDTIPLIEKLIRARVFLKAGTH
jgi:hypothetical protein